MSGKQDAGAEAGAFDDLDDLTDDPSFDVDLSAVLDHLAVIEEALRAVRAIVERQAIR